MTAYDAFQDSLTGTAGYRLVSETQCPKSDDPLEVSYTFGNPPRVPVKAVSLITFDDITRDKPEKLLIKEPRTGRVAVFSRLVAEL